MRNSGTRANNLLPISGREVPGAAYASALASFWDSLPGPSAFRGKSAGIILLGASDDMSRPFWSSCTESAYAGHAMGDEHAQGVLAIPHLTEKQMLYAVGKSI